MPLTLTWSDVALRLALTLLASGFFGFNRGEQGHAAGLRTMLLVGLAAAVTMLQVNGWLGMAGRPEGSFVSLDLMRLPLGVLSGIGFIGAGAILRRGEMIVGVTTAATLWFVTIIGLCLGGGQLLLGCIATILGMTVLTVVKFIDERMPQMRRARMSLSWTGDALREEELRELLTKVGLRISHLSLSCRGEERELSVELRWRARAQELSIPPAVVALSQRGEVSRFTWRV